MIHCDTILTLSSAKMPVKLLSYKIKTMTVPLVRLKIQHTKVFISMQRNQDMIRLLPARDRLTTRTDAEQLLRQRISPEVLGRRRTGKTNFILFPNPVVSDLSIQFNMLKDAPVSIELIDLSGRLLLNQKQQLTPGMHRITLKDIKQKGVASGIYMLRVTTDKEVRTTRIVVK